MRILGSIFGVEITNNPESGPLVKFLSEDDGYWFPTIEGSGVMNGFWLPDTIKVLQQAQTYIETNWTKSHQGFTYPNLPNLVKEFTMDQQQYEIACEIVKQDCTLEGMLKDRIGNFCFIGGLYTVIDPDWAMGVIPIYQNPYLAVEEAFGIDSEPVIEANDNDKSGDPDRIIPLRRRRVLQALKKQLEV